MWEKGQIANPFFQSPSFINGVVGLCANFPWSICSYTVLSTLSHTLTHFFLKCEPFLNDTTSLVCVNSVFLLYIFKFMSVVKQKCLILSKQTLPFNRNEFHPQVYFILAAIYCLGTVSNCNGKLCGWPCWSRLPKFNVQEINTYFSSLSQTDFI